MSEPEIEIDVVSVKKKMESDPEMLLLDCRQPVEYETARIDGSVLIPMGEITQRLEDLEAYRDKPIVVY